jgi:hypothetical protein
MAASAIQSLDAVPIINAMRQFISQLPAREGLRQ